MMKIPSIFNISALMVGISVLLPWSLSQPAFAQSADTSVATTQAGYTNPDPVFVFNRICYAQVHDVQAIQAMSLKLAWKSMEPEKLEQFRSYKDPKVLDGWEVQVGERLFQVGVTKGNLTDKMKQTFPELASGTATSCSMILDDQQLADEFLPNMQRLAGKEPVSSDVPEGLLRTTTWAGGNADLKVFLFAKTPATGKGGLLNVTIIQK